MRALSSFRLIIFSFSAALFFSPLASAQVTTCVATAVPPVVRAEGIAELVGDIVLTCSGGPTDVANYTVDVVAALNVNVTNDETAMFTTRCW